MTRNKLASQYHSHDHSKNVEESSKIIQASSYRKQAVQSTTIQNNIHENPVDDSFSQETFQKARKHDESPTDNLVRNSKKLE